MHRNAAATYATKNVRINCVMPGMIRTPASSEAHEESDVEAKTAMVSGTGLLLERATAAFQGYCFIALLLFSATASERYCFSGYCFSALLLFSATAFQRYCFSGYCFLGYCFLLAF
jgi:hypothetical protein